MESEINKLLVLIAMFLVFELSTTLESQAAKPCNQRADCMLSK